MAEGEGAYVALFFSGLLSALLIPLLIFAILQSHISNNHPSLLILQSDIQELKCLTDRWPAARSTATAIVATVGAVGLLGSIAGVARNRYLALFFLLSMIILLLLTASLLAVAYHDTANYNGDQPSMAPLGYTIGQFPRLLQWAVRDPSHWSSLVKCTQILDHRCADLEQVYRIPQDFYNANISPIQVGCCKPPTECGFEYTSPTFWLNPNNTAWSQDCMAYSNNQTILCSMCDTCRAGVLADYYATAHRTNPFLFTIVAALFVLCLPACCIPHRSKSSAPLEDVEVKPYL